MKKVVRSRKGFTLVEIVLVIAIIVILASVSFVGIKAMLNNANKNSTAVELHAGAWYVEGSAGQEGYYPYLIGGSTKYVKVVPKGTPDAKYWSDWDDMYAQVNAINVVTPMPQSGGYTPGGSGGLNPGTGGSGGNPVDPGTGGGDNPGDNPGGGGTPELWNGHTEDWWNENDAKWEEKIQQLKDQGIPPENIHVTKDERGHITGVTWSNPTSGGGSSSSTGGGSGSGSGSGNTGTDNPGNQSGTQTGTSGATGNGMTVDAANNGSRVKEFSTTGNTTTFTVTDLNGNGDYSFKITKDGNNYVIDMSGDVMWQINYQFPGFNYNGNQAVYTLNNAQKEWLTNKYHITFN